MANVLEQGSLKRSPYPLRFLTLTFLVTGAILSWLGVGAFETYRLIKQQRWRDLRIMELRGRILQLDEVLTMSARMAAATGDTGWELRYRRFEAELDSAIKEVLRLAPERDAAEETDAANLALVKMENLAFGLVREGRRPEAQGVLFSENYELEKQRYSEGMARLDERLKDKVDAALDREEGRAYARLVAIVVLLPLLMITWAYAWWAISRRIEEHQRAESELRRTADELGRSNAQLEQFAYVASHDLQEPLRSIASYAQLLALRYEGKLDGNADDFIRYVVDGAKRMRTLIDDLLAYSRLARDHKPLESTDCNAVVSLVLGDLAASIKERRAQVTCDGLPTLTADPSLLSHMFQNLIQNALKFAGAQAPAIHVSATRQLGEWVFSVRDNGIGIKPEYAERIFLIFQRLHTRDEYPGNGMGLAICKKIAEHHGGRIWVESEPGKGSIFFFTIPAERAAPVALEARAGARQPA
jgi:signal transduction histidine kinase